MPLPRGIIVKLIDNAVSALLKYRNEAAGHAFAVTGGGRDMGAIAAFRFVENDGAIMRRATRPLPIGETLFQWRIAAVHVEIAIALPAHMRAIECHLDARARRDGPPRVIAIFVEREGVSRDRSGNDAHRAANASGNGDRDLIDADRQRFTIPGKAARADGEGIGGTIDGAARALGHCPAFAAPAIYGDIDGAVVQWVGRAVAPG